MKLFSRITARLRIRTQRGERGAIIALAVPGLALCVVACALGVDLGRIAVDKREDQRVADIAALDAARAIGFILNTTNAAGYDAAAQTAATASAVRNGWVIGQKGRTVTALVGTIDSSNNFSHGSGTSAVQVTTTSHIENAFLPGSRDLTATAVAFVGSPIGAFSVGSTLVNLNTNRTYIDAVLKNMLGINAATNITGVSYDGLATGNVQLSALQTALIANGINVGTVDQLLNTSITIPQLLTATATALGSSTASTEINDLLAFTSASSATVKLADLLDVSTPSDSAVLQSKVNVFQLVSGAAQLANGSNFASLGTGISLGNGSTVNASVQVISPAQTGIGPVGTTASNAQAVVRLDLNLRVGLLFGNLVTARIEYAVGSANGTLTSIVCGSSPSVGVSASSSAATVTISNVTESLLGTLTLTPNASIGAHGPTALTFNGPTFPTASQRVPSSTTGMGSTSIGITGSLTALTTLVTTLTNPLSAVLSSVLTNAATTLNPALVALGIDIGGADVTALGIFPDPSSCGGHPRIAK